MNQTLNIKELWILPTQFIYMFHMILTTNNNNLPKQYSLIGVCIGDAIYFLSK